MGRGGQNQDVVLSPSEQRRGRRRRHRHRHRSSDGGIDHPPSIASLLHGQWQPRDLKLHTAQRLCSLVHPPPLKEDFRDPSGNVLISAGTGPCDPVVAFDRYVLSVTDDGRICFYEIVYAAPDQDEGRLAPSHREGTRRKRITRDQQIVDSVSPMAVVECSESIVVLVATPMAVSVIDYLNTADTQQLVVPPQFLGHVVAITSDGQLHILECTYTTAHSMDLKVTKIHTWGTGTCNPSCLTLRPYRSSHWRICVGYDSGCLEQWILSIPVDVADSETPPEHIETQSALPEHAKVQENIGNETDKITPVGDNHMAESTVSQSRMLPSWNPRLQEANASLSWRGCFETSIKSIVSIGLKLALDNGEEIIPNIPDGASLSCDEHTIHEESMKPVWPDNKESIPEKNNAAAGVDDSLSGLGLVSTSPPNTKDAFNETSALPLNDNTKAALHQTMQDEGDSSLQLSGFLAVCIATLRPAVDGRIVGGGSSSVQVVNLTALARAWNNTSTDGMTETTSQTMAIPLEAFCVWPDVGMEPLDMSLFPSEDVDPQRRLPEAIRNLPSRGSDRLCSCQGMVPCFASGLSDGTVALMDAIPQDDNTISWGVSDNSNQLLCTYPVIAMSPIEFMSGPHVACCLRGGTVYIVPVISQGNGDIVVCLPPIDESDDAFLRYIHGFTAGNAQVRSISGGQASIKTRIPVMVYAGAAGVLDVYSCHLLGRNYGEVDDDGKGDEIEAVLQELVDNGSMQLLCEMLRSIDDNDPLLDESVWRLARDECLHNPMAFNDASHVLKEVASPTFVQTRSLLLTQSLED